MKHIAKTVSRFLLLGLTAGCGFFALQENNRVSSPVLADDVAPAKTYSAADFVNEEETDPRELTVSITESTTTDTSQSLNVAFKSNTSEGFKTGKGNYIVTIIDPEYTGNVNEPVGENFDNYDAQTGLPILEGSVAFVIGGTNKEVYLPSTLTRDESFIINVTTIGSHCVTADGQEYHDLNRWYDTSNNLRINSIYIPETIRFVEPEAFIGVPDEVTIAYEGQALTEAFDPDWTDAKEISFGARISNNNKNAGVGNKVNDLSDPVNFIIGSEASEGQGEEYNRPLVIQYDKISNGNRETIYEALPLSNTVGNAYDSVGKISSSSASRLLSYKLGPGEEIDDSSIIFHNLMKASDTSEIDTSKTYWVKPELKYNEKLDLSKILSFKASGNSTFAGFSVFSLTMDKNLDVVSNKYPEPHSLYLDVKSDIYEQNKSQIEKGETRIRYSLNNLYLSSYRFVYESGGQLKEAIVPITSVVYYQVLESDKDNKVSVIVENSQVAPDFSADKVRTFELMNITVQMDLFVTSNTGSTSVLGKSAVSFKFAYITVRNDEKIDIFNWNIFLAIFTLVFMGLYAAGAFVLYKVLKEKYKNDEFRRINDKKYLKKAILSGLGFTVIALAILFIVMRVVGFANTIVAFNPTDPLLIIFAVAGMIIGGYFIVILIKAIKAEKERRKAIRLRLNEDTEDDGTN